MEGLSNHKHEIKDNKDEDKILARKEQGSSGTMDVTGSLRKIGKELLELDPNQDDLMLRIEAASWLVTYIADALDVELMKAKERGRRMALGISEGDINQPVRYQLNNEGTRIYDTISGDEL